MERLEEHIWRAVSFRRAEILRELADGRTEREAAHVLGVELSTVRSHVEELKGITGCASVRELGRWWRANRPGWAGFVLELGGVRLHDVSA